MQTTVNARAIAFYLPQFHPIPENDEWWGRGFTEWTNVAQARPLFRGHYQPHIPADLGFYDLRLPETRQAQAEMAWNYGIEGFCYWHYWYAGRQVLERPFEAVLNSGEPQFPFCLGWANHSWSKIWTGQPNVLLIEQTYPGLEDYKRHFYYLLRAFGDSRYVTVNGKPLLVVMRPRQIPNVRQMTDYWRELAHQAGLKGLYLVGCLLSHEQLDSFGFDATTFPNHYLVPRNLPLNPYLRACKRRLNKLLGRPDIFAYRDALTFLLSDNLDKIDEHPCLFPNWDNTPRFGSQGYLFHQSTPELFGLHLGQAMAQILHKPLQERLVFIKSWNEWAEGNHLEPDQRYGHRLLEELRARIVRETLHPHSDGAQ